MRKQLRGVLGAALLAAAVFGCAGADGPAVASIGGAGSACALPVTFDVAKPWKTKRTEPVNDNSSWFPFSHVCKIEAGTGEAKVTLFVYTPDGPVGDSPQSCPGDGLSDEPAGFTDQALAAPASRGGDAQGNGRPIGGRKRGPRIAGVQAREVLHEGHALLTTSSDIADRRRSQNGNTAKGEGQQVPRKRANAAAVR
ncbi:lipoprotein [Streptomyces inhibens]|uniref:lipoprotein n=1 Tax=Streptomyces inhibens TaxID=2293571 RepID=UPI0036C9F685